jgi:hypothetical protein
MFFSLNSFAQDYPEHLVNMMEKSRDYFEVYGQKSPSEIEDGIYDESESVLFSQVDQINGLDIIFNKEEIRKLKAQMVKLIAESFSKEQIEAIIRVAKSPSVNKKISAKFFEVALEYKSGKILAHSINFLLSPKLKTMR